MTLVLLCLTHAQEVLAQVPLPAPAPTPQPVAPSPVPWQTTMAAFGTVGSAALAATVAVVSTRRERRAREERDQLASDQAASEHRRPASLVSAWVDEGYTPNADGRTYTRSAAVHIANEGDQPVFDVSALIGVGFKTRNIGPLAVPNRIPVLPPRRELVWDITLPLLAHQDTESPCAAVRFTDSSGARWTRSFNGSLAETTGSEARLSAVQGDENTALEQLGDLSEPHNPMVVAVEFLSLLQESAEDLDLDALLETLAPEATGWKGLTALDVAAMRREVAGYSFGTMPYYAVPQVAYIKLLPSPGPAVHVVTGEGDLDVHVKFLTLTFAQGRGWRVFGFGRVPVERILFPPGTLAPATDRAASRRWSWRASRDESPL